MEIIYKAISELKPYAQNAKLHPAEQITHIANSIKEFGFKQPIVIDTQGEVIAGHGRLEAAKKLKLDTVPCLIADDLTDEQIKAFRLADNKTNESEFDFELLNVELEGIIDIDMGDFGFEPPSEDIAEKYSEKTPGALKQRFIMPPFSVLDARQGDWQKRKKEWLKILDSGKGRADNLIGGGIQQLAQALGTNLTGTSIFDPVLAEVLLHWFSPLGGGSVRPIRRGKCKGHC